MVKFYISENTGHEASVWTEIECALPFNVRLTLDESLDSGQLFIPQTTRDIPYQPFTRLKIVTTEGEVDTEEYWYVGTDQVTFVNTLLSGTKIYEHNLSIIELTKHQERYIINTLDFTNPLVEDYGTSSDTFIYNVSKDVTFGGAFYTKASDSQVNDLSLNPYNTPVLLGSNLPALTIAVPSPDRTYDDFVGLEAYVVLPNGEREDLTITFTQPLLSPDSIINVGASSAFTLSGVYDVYVNFLKKYTPPLDPEERTAYTILQQVAVVYEATAVEKWTFVNAVKRVLQSGKQRTTQSQLYTLDPNIETEYAGLLLPEMTLTKTNLWEALLTLGEPYNLIPRTICVSDNWHIITFDKKIPSEEVTNSGTLISEQSIQSIDQYASSVDSNVANVLNVGSNGAKTVNEPGYQTINSTTPILLGKTTVTETVGVRITNDVALFKTSKPIERLTKVIIFYEDAPVTIDIVKYCYEEADYNGLFDTNSIYPYSKAFALKYKIGGTTISELNHIVKHRYDPAFNSPAIENIAERENVAFVVPTDYADLKAFIEYIPFDDIRTTEEKTFREDIRTESDLFYNQSSNIVNSLAFGESQKSAIERLGNIDFIKTYQYEKKSDLPLVGQKLDNFIISNMAIKDYQDYLQSTLYLVKHNKINEFIGINSQRRLSEVAINGATDRELLYSEDVVFGDNETDDAIALTNAGIEKYLNTFIQSATNFDIGQSALVKTVDRNDIVINNLIMPLTRLGKGNSLVFSFNMQDNFSAGINSVDTVIDASDTKVSAYVRYADYLGEFKDIEIKVADIGYYFDGVDLIGVDPYLLPQNKIIGLNEIAPPINTIIDYTLLNANKGNKEIIGSTYQLNSKKNRENIVIGSGLQINNALIGEIKGEVPKVYLLPNEINESDRYIDLTGALDKGNVVINTAVAGSRFIEPVTNTDTAAYKAVAVAFSDGELLIGENIEIEPSESSSNIYINFKKKEII